VGAASALVVSAGAVTLLGRTPGAPVFDAVQLMDGELTAVVSAPGVVGSDDTVDIKYPLLARIEQLFVREGDRVQTGQVLARMETATLSAQLAQARAALARTEVQLEEARRLMREATAPGASAAMVDGDSLSQRLTPAQAAVARTAVQLWHAQQQWERMTVLVGKGFVAKSDADAADAAYRSLLRQMQIDEATERLDAESKMVAYHALRRQQDADRAVVQQIQIQLDQAEIRAPRAAVVTALYVQEGEVLGSPTATRPSGKPNNVLMTLSSADRFVVYADVNALDVGQLRPGQITRLNVDSIAGQELQGTVQSIALEPTVTSNVTTYRLTVSFSEKPPGLRLGLPVNARVTTGSEVGVLAPLSAIQRGLNGSRALRVNQGRAEAVLVELGLRTATAVVVRRGLAPRDTILLDGGAEVGAGLVELRLRPWKVEPTVGGATGTVRVPKPVAKSVFQQLFQP
jgi:HlyD family secretion protein